MNSPRASCNGRWADDHGGTCATAVSSTTLPAEARLRLPNRGRCPYKKARAGRLVRRRKWLVVGRRHRAGDEATERVTGENSPSHGRGGSAAGDLLRRQA